MSIKVCDVICFVEQKEVQVAIGSHVRLGHMCKTIFHLIYIYHGEALDDPAHPAVVQKYEEAKDYLEKNVLPLAHVEHLDVDDVSNDQQLPIPK